MSSYNVITKEISLLDSLETLTTTYARLSAIRMSQVRENVLSTRSFMQSVDHVFAVVLREYYKHHFGLAKQVTFLPHNGKVVAVFIAANTGLHGEAVRKTFDLLSTRLAEGTEVAIVGQLGVEMFTQFFPNRPYTFFDFPDNRIDEGKLVKLLEHIAQYELIEVYFPKFYSLVTQKPEKQIISVNPERPAESHNDKRYIFEPNMLEILRFFEGEIFASLVNTTFHESQLAKFASRIVAMDKASQNIKTRSKAMKIARLRLLHEASNRKQLSLMSTILRWRHP